MFVWWLVTFITITCNCRHVHVPNCWVVKVPKNETDIPEEGPILWYSDQKISCLYIVGEGIEHHHWIWSRPNELVTTPTRSDIYERPLTSLVNVELFYVWINNILSSNNKFYKKFTYVFVDHCCFFYSTPREDRSTGPRSIGNHRGLCLLFSRITYVGCSTNYLRTEGVILFPSLSSEVHLRLQKFSSFHHTGVPCKRFGLVILKQVHPTRYEKISCVRMPHRI